MNFTIGVLNGSQAADPAVLDTCRDVIVTNWLNQIPILVNYTQNLDINALYTLYDMMNMTDMIAHDCYSGIETAGAVYMSWGQMNNT